MQLNQALCELDTTLNLVKSPWDGEMEKVRYSSGRTLVLQAGEVFEKVGLGFSHVLGDELPVAASKKRQALAGQPFEVLGLSAIIHPLNPYIPTAHLNLRFFSAADHWWFGGGFDLTPYYPFMEDVRHWHNMAKKACAGFGEGVYAQYKAACDEYFYLPHRTEPRGIGGLFFDDLNAWGFDRCFEFIRSVGTYFMEGYLPIAERRRDMQWGQRERDFQCYRRGRYVEFNLVYDRGTLFGLQSGGRIESILVSLPPQVNWSYDWKPEAGTPEAELYEVYLRPRDWAD